MISESETATAEPVGSDGEHSSRDEMISRLRGVMPQKARPNSAFDAAVIGDEIVLRPGSKRSREDALWMMRMILFMGIAGIIASLSIFYMFPRDMNGWTVELMGLTVWVILGVAAVLYLRPFIKGTFEFCRIDTISNVLTCDSDTRIPLADIESFVGSGMDVCAVTRHGEEHFIMRDPDGMNGSAFMLRALKILSTICAKPSEIRSED